MPLPLSFACHTFILAARDEDWNRFEVIGLQPANHQRRLCGNIFKDYYPLEGGFPWISEYLGGFGPHFSTTEHWLIEGDENSLAFRMYNFLHGNELCSYPFKDTYKMFRGPNSNTFTSWFLSQFDGHSVELPNNAWGKSF